MYPCLPGDEAYCTLICRKACTLTKPPYSLLADDIYSYKPNGSECDVCKGMRCIAREFVWAAIHACI